MNIVSCPNCGALIHQDTCCYHCGATESGKCISNPKIHPNVRTDYAAAWNKLRNRMFGEALKHSAVLTQWMSGESSVYWLRLLANRECISDLELIHYAGRIKEDLDYRLAVSCASETELLVYQEVADLAEKVYDEMLRETRKSVQQKKLDTGILQKKVQLEGDTQESFDRILKDWASLAHVQQNIGDLESEWRIVTAEEARNMKAAGAMLDTVKEQLSRMKECTEQKRHSFLQKIRASEKMTESAVDKLLELQKTHALGKKLKNCVDEYYDLHRKISVELEAQKKRQNKMRELIEKLEQIDADYMNTINSNELHPTKALTRVVGSSVLHKVCQKYGVAR